MCAFRTRYRTWVAQAGWLSDPTGAVVPTRGCATVPITSALTSPLLGAHEQPRLADSLARPAATMSVLGCCCLLTISTALCLSAFFWLHSENADGGAMRPWLVVFAPVMVLASIVVLALALAPLVLPAKLQPSLRSWGTWGLSSMAVVAICMRVAATAAGDAALPSWPMALAPLAAMLFVRAATLPPPPPPVLGGPEATGLECWRLLGRLELPAGGASLLLLYLQLEESSAARGWWAVVAPLILIEACSLVAGVRTILSTVQTNGPPASIIVRAHARTRAYTHTLSLSLRKRE